MQSDGTYVALPQYIMLINLALQQDLNVSKTNGRNWSVMMTIIFSPFSRTLISKTSTCCCQQLIFVFVNARINLFYSNDGNNNCILTNNC